VVSDLVTHDLHDVVAVGDETERQRGGQDSELPDGHGRLGLCCVAGGPGRVDDGPGADSVTNVVGAVGKRGSAGSQDLHERVRVLDLVGVLGRMAVHTLHTLALGSAVDTSLRGVDVVVYSVQAAYDDHGGDALERDDHVLLLVDFTGADLVLVEVAHGPCEGALLGAKLGVETLLALGDELLVAELAVLGNDGALLSIAGHDAVVGVAVDGFGLEVLVVLDDGVVADTSGLGSLGCGALEEERPHEGMVPAH
jgi:hypothetical protein